MIYKLLFFLLNLGVALSVTSTPVLKCPGASEGLFKSVEISTEKGICTKLPCILSSGKNVSVGLKFLTTKKIENITLKCNATALGVTMEYPVPNAKQGCKLLTNTACPVPPNTEAELKLTMNVEKSFPKVDVDLIVYLLNQANEIVSCFEVFAKVVRAKF